MTKKNQLIAENERQVLGRELAMWRARTGKTQSAVAKENGMSRWTVSRIEKDPDSVDPKTAYKVYAYLARQLRMETMASQSIDQYRVDKMIADGKAEVDGMILLKDNRWEVQP